MAADSHVVVTGATGRIGSAICRRLAGEGHSIVVGYNTRAAVADDLVADFDGIRAQEDATPLARLATGEDVASAVRACINDLVFTTGSIIPVDGGRPLGVT